MGVEKVAMKIIDGMLSFALLKSGCGWCIQSALKGPINIMGRSEILINMIKIIKLLDETKTKICHM